MLNENGMHVAIQSIAEIFGEKENKVATKINESKYTDIATFLVLLCSSVSDLTEGVFNLASFKFYSGGFIMKVFLGASLINLNY